MHSGKFSKALEKAKRRVDREKKAKIREEKKAQAASSEQTDYLMITTIKINRRILLK